mmetsp:Transcript_56127/g.111545  ORF Transcript_56127/g.111545 Transcript_56127/m.111545 type:complete len:236 (-) Transcript_56127:125-832(-)
MVIAAKLSFSAGLRLKATCRASRSESSTPTGKIEASVFATSLEVLARRRHWLPGIENSFKGTNFVAINCPNCSTKSCEHLCSASWFFTCSCAVVIALPVSATASTAFFHVSCFASRTARISSALCFVTPTLLTTSVCSEAKAAILSCAMAIAAWWPVWSPVKCSERPSRNCRWYRCRPPASLFRPDFGNMAATMSRQLTGSSAAATGVSSNPSAGMHQSGRVATGGDRCSGVADS